MLFSSCGAARRHLETSFTIRRGQAPLDTGSRAVSKRYLETNSFTSRPGQCQPRYVHLMVLRDRPSTTTRLQAGFQHATGTQVSYPNDLYKTTRSTPDFDTCSPSCEAGVCLKSTRLDNSSAGSVMFTNDSRFHVHHVTDVSVC